MTISHSCSPSARRRWCRSTTPRPSSTKAPRKGSGLRPTCSTPLASEGMTVDPALHLVVMLLLAAITKLREPDVFAGVVEQYDLLPRRFVRPFALALPVVELGGALGILMPST